MTLRNAFDDLALDTSVQAVLQALQATLDVDDAGAQAILTNVLTTLQGGIEVFDEDTVLEVLADQTGAGGVLTFTFAGGAAQPWVYVDMGDPVRVSTTQTPSPTLGIPVPAGSPFPIPVMTETLKVFAESSQTVTVYGTR